MLGSRSVYCAVSRGPIFRRPSRLWWSVYPPCALIAVSVRWPIPKRETYEAQLIPIEVVWISEEPNLGQRLRGSQCRAPGLERVVLSRGFRDLRSCDRIRERGLRGAVRGCLLCGDRYTCWQRSRATRIGCSHEPAGGQLCTGAPSVQRTQDGPSGRFGHPRVAARAYPVSPSVKP